MSYCYMGEEEGGGAERLGKKDLGRTDRHSVTFPTPSSYSYRKSYCYMGEEEREGKRSGREEKNGNREEGREEEVES